MTGRMMMTSDSVWIALLVFSLWVAIFAIDLRLSNRIDILQTQNDILKGRISYLTMQLRRFVSNDVAISECKKVEDKDESEL